MQLQRASVWYGLWVGRVTGLLFFENESGRAVTVNRGMVISLYGINWNGTSTKCGFNTMVLHEEKQERRETIELFLLRGSIIKINLNISTLYY